MKNPNDVDYLKPDGRVFESVPGLISWTVIFLTFLLVYTSPVIFVFFVIAFTVYWVFSAFRIAFLAWLGMSRIKNVDQTNWKEKLNKDFPQWGEYYYCALLPYASESINILRPTVKSIAQSNFPANRRILCLSSEKALPAGRFVAEQIKKEFASEFEHIIITEHELLPGELKGKASNQNHAGRLVYDKLLALGIDPGKVLLSSNDADVLNNPQYPTYLLHSYLSAGENRDAYIYQPIPTDYNNFWSAQFFSRIIISTGVLWRIALQMRGDYRCTVYSFYSMTFKTLHEIGFWDTDQIPEDERTMFKAIVAFGARFKVIPLFMMTKGSPVSGKHTLDSFQEQYIQIRRWAWGASEFAHSMLKYKKATKEGKKALFGPIFNQLRTSTEWALSSFILMFAGFLPGIFHPQFQHTPLGQSYAQVLSVMMSLASLLVITIMIMDKKFAPPKPSHRGRMFSIFSYAQWVFAPVIGLVLSAIPAFESQTRMILGKRIAYVESRKETDDPVSHKPVDSVAIS